MPCLDISFEKIERGLWYLKTPLRLTVKAGDCVVLRGKNGSGKTSVLQAVAALLPYTGVCHVRPLTETIRLKSIGLDGLSMTTVYQHMAFWQTIYGATRNAVQERLTFYGLMPYTDTPLEHLSVGLAHRVALARMGLGDSTIWLMDEPFSGLDDVSSGLLSTDIQQALRQGKAIVMACHQNSLHYKEIIL